MEVALILTRVVSDFKLNSVLVEFEEHEDISCTHFGEQTQLLTCLSEGNGIEGSSFLATGDKLGLIVPRPSNTSVLFNIHFEIKQISNPLQTELKNLLKEKENIQVRRLIEFAFSFALQPAYFAENDRPNEKK